MKRASLSSSERAVIQEKCRPKPDKLQDRYSASYEGKQSSSSVDSGKIRIPLWPEEGQTPQKDLQAESWAIHGGKLLNKEMMQVT